MNFVESICFFMHYLIREFSHLLINKLSRKLEHARELNDLLTRFIDIDGLDVPKEIKDLIKEKIQICEDDKTKIVANTKVW